ncbi:MAG: pilus assembly protein PilM [Cellulomonas sp.]
MTNRRIGVDLGRTAVRVAEVDGAPGKRLRLLRFGEHPLPPGCVERAEVIDPKRVSAAVRRACKAAGVRSRDVVLGVAGEHAIVRPMTLPAASREQMRASLPFLVQESLPVPVADCVLDFYPIRREGQQVEGLLVAVPDAATASAVQAVEQAGLRVVGVDLAAFALVRAVVEPRGPHAVVAVVDVGADGVQIVVAEHRVPQLVRFGAAAGAALVADLARILQVDPGTAEQALHDDRALHGDLAPVIAGHTERMAATVAETLAFHAQSGNRPVEAVLLTGRGAGLPGFGQYLATFARVPVSLPRADGVFAVDRKAARTCDGSLPAWAVAAGLAVGGAA